MQRCKASIVQPLGRRGQISGKAGLSEEERSRGRGQMDEALLHHGGDQHAHRLSITE